MDKMKHSLAMAENMHSQVESMFEEGLIKADNEGKYVAVRDPNESEHIRSTNAQASKVK